MSTATTNIPSQTYLSVFSEMLWWVLIVVFTAIVLYPLHLVLDAGFLRINIGLVVLFTILFRYTIFLEQVKYLAPLWVRFMSVIIAGILFFQVFIQMQSFFELFDTHDMNDFLTKNPESRFAPEVIHEKFDYFKKEFVFFSTGNLILIVAFTFRNIGSLWIQLKNKKYQS